MQQPPKLSPNRYNNPSTILKSFIGTGEGPGGGNVSCGIFTMPHSCLLPFWLIWPFLPLPTNSHNRPHHLLDFRHYFCLVLHSCPSLPTPYSTISSSLLVPVGSWFSHPYQLQTLSWNLYYLFIYHLINLSSLVSHLRPIPYAPACYDLRYIVLTM